MELDNYKLEDIKDKNGNVLGTGFIPITTEREEIVNFLKDKIPYVLDLEKEDIKYDKNNIYYKIYKYIRKLEKEKEEK
jgi:GTPase Era involved in 16S rRNA processing